MTQEEWIEFYYLLKQLDNDNLVAFIQVLKEMQELEGFRQPASACLLKE